VQPGGREWLEKLRRRTLAPAAPAGKLIVAAVIWVLWLAAALLFAHQAGFTLPGGMLARSAILAAAVMAAAALLAAWAYGRLLRRFAVHIRRLMIRHDVTLELLGAGSGRLEPRKGGLPLRSDPSGADLSFQRASARLIANWQGAAARLKCEPYPVSRNIVLLTAMLIELLCTALLFLGIIDLATLAGGGASYLEGANLAVRLALLPVSLFVLILTHMLGGDLLRFSPALALAELLLGELEEGAA
jgi:hypothetical protein